MSKLFYSTSEVANLFRVNRVTIYRWVKDGKVKAYGIGKHLKIPLSEVERLLREFGLADMVVENGSNGLGREESKGTIGSAVYGSRKKLVIAIEDDKRILKLIKELFKRKKLEEACHLETFSDSLEVAMLIGRGKPDLVLLDITMPGLNGFELAEKIEKIHRGVKIVVMTAYPVAKSRDDAEGVKNFHSLAKPIAPEELYKTIVAALH